MHFNKILISILLLSGMPGFALALPPSPVFVRILHTNDLHSKFRPERGALGLGGVARIKTLINAIRSSDPDALVVDGGDWSEGDIYYRVGLGRESLRFMDLMGYDLAVVGNHDWLNGPARLVQAVQEADLKMKVLAANVNLDQYAGAEEFRKTIPPYVIREVKGVKIAFIGAITFEFFYKSFFQQAQITIPSHQFRRLVKWLKNEVDAIVVVSHNKIEFNESLMKAIPDIDLIVGAHDHVKLTQPIAVSRGKKRPKGWIVEAGAWGHYLGETVIEVQPRTRDSGAPEDFNGKSQVRGAAYRLIEVNASIPEDPEVLKRIATLECQIESEMGEAVFHDQVGTSEIDFPMWDGERVLAHLVTDSYRTLTGADIGFEHFPFIYANLPAGEIRTADAYNVLAPIYDPESESTWKVQTFEMKGIHLFAWLNLLFAPKSGVMGEEVAGSMS
ncbi:MAG: metallophosphoesterase, partial [Bdellovibrionota bacterium]